MSKSLGLILLRAGLITPADLIEAHNGLDGQTLGERLVALGVVSEEQVAQAFATDLHIPNVRLGGALIEPCALEIVPRELAERHLVCPYLLDGERLHLVMADPLDVDAIAAVERRGIRVRPAVSTPADIREAIARSYGRDPATVAGRLVVEAITAARVHATAAPRELIPLARLGLEPEQLRLVKYALDEPQGLVLVAGTRGSGRTTTLYAALSHVRCPGIRIVSVEERIEARIKGVDHREVDAWTGETVGDEFRVALADDPDVAMVGEIADADIATVALEGAARGHLVLGGIHATDALGALGRLLELAPDRATAAAQLTLVVAQRLVRRLCGRCREAYQPGHEVAVCLGLTPSMPAFRARGCQRCDGTGYQGVVALFEVLPIDAALREMIARGAAPTAVAREARGRGLRSLQQAAAAVVRQGITSPEEVFRILQPGTADAAPLPEAQSIALPPAFAPSVHGAARHAHRRRRTRMQAFSLVELLVVVTMLGVLAAAAWQLVHWRSDRVVDRLRAAAQAAATAQESYLATHGSYASGDCATLDGFAAPDGIVCTTAGDATAFRVSARTVDGARTCLWTSRPSNGAPQLTCGDA